MHVVIAATIVSPDSESWGCVVETGKGILVCVMIAIDTVNDIYGHVVEGTQLGDTLERQSTI